MAKRTHCYYLNIKQAEQYCRYFKSCPKTGYKNACKLKERDMGLFITGRDKNVVEVNFEGYAILKSKQKEEKVKKLKGRGKREQK